MVEPGRDAVNVDVAVLAVESVTEEQRIAVVWTVVLPSPPSIQELYASCKTKTLYLLPLPSPWQPLFTFLSINLPSLGTSYK